MALLVKRDLKAGVMETGCRRKQRKAFRREDGLRSLCWFALRLPRTLSTATLQFSLCCLQRRASVFFQIREQLILKMGVKKRHRMLVPMALYRLKSGQYSVVVRRTVRPPIFCTVSITLHFSDFRRVKAHSFVVNS